MSQMDGILQKDLEQHLGPLKAREDAAVWMRILLE